MNFVKLQPNGVARVSVYAAKLDNKGMQDISFLIDTGATRTTLNKSILLDFMGYTEEWLQKNRIVLAENLKPKLADGRTLNAYGIPAMELTIGAHVIRHNDYFLTADDAPGLGFLLGTDILSYFDLFFKFSEIRMYYEFRKDRVKHQINPGDSFAYGLNSDKESNKK